MVSAYSPENEARGLPPQEKVEASEFQCGNDLNTHGGDDVRTSVLPSLRFWGYDRLTAKRMMKRERKG